MVTSYLMLRTAARNARPNSRSSSLTGLILSAMNSVALGDALLVDPGKPGLAKRDHHVVGVCRRLAVVVVRMRGVEHEVVRDAGGVVEHCFVELGPVEVLKAVLFEVFGVHFFSFTYSSTKYSM